jgi:hypothetical protein
MGAPRKIIHLPRQAQYFPLHQYYLRQRTLLRLRRSHHFCLKESAVVPKPLPVLLCPERRGVEALLHLLPVLLRPESRGGEAILHLLKMMVRIMISTKMTRMLIMCVANQAVNNIMEGKDDGDLAAFIANHRNVFMERAFPSGKEQAYSKPKSISAAIKSCRPKKELDYITFVVGIWQAGVEIRKMASGPKRDSLLDFCREHPLGNNYIHQFCLEEIYVPGDFMFSCFKICASRPYAVILLLRYVNTQIHKRWCKGLFFRRCSFVYPFREKGVFVPQIHGYTLQNDHFLFVYLFFYL